MSDSQPLYSLMTDLSGARTAEANHAGDVIKHDVWRSAHERGEAVPTSGSVDRSNYHGGEVFTPKGGLHEHVFYFDYSSMYPNSMRDGNMSPDTILGVGDMALMRSDYTESEVQWSYIDPRPVKHLDDEESYRDFTDGEFKMVVDDNSMKWRDDWENIQEHIERIYFLPHSERVGLLSGRADQYIRWNKSYTGRMYRATKRVRNALFGSVTFTNFPFYDWRVGEATTLAGRLLLTFGRNEIVALLRSEFGAEGVSVVVGDTDGFGVSIDVEAEYSEMLTRAQDAVEQFNEAHLPGFVERTFGVDGTDTYHELELESHARRLFVPDSGDGSGVKKTYAQHITMEDGEVCDEFAIKGFEAKRSDTSDVTTAVQTDVLHTILSESPEKAREQVYSRVREAVQAIRHGDVPLRAMGQRGGLSKPPEKYGTGDRRPQPIYRGALYAKQHIDGEQTFSKPMKFPVSDVGGGYPSRYTATTAQDGDPVDYISLEDPSNMPESITLDRETVITETLKQPLQPILQTMGWEWVAITEGHERTKLEDFMGGVK